MNIQEDQDLQTSIRLVYEAYNVALKAADFERHRNHETHMSPAFNLVLNELKSMECQLKALLKRKQTVGR